MNTPLWSPDNNTIHSSIFEVKAGKAVSLFAVGLSEDKAVASGEFRGPQVICISKILYDFISTERTVKAPPVNLCDCGFVYGACDTAVLSSVEAIVNTKGCPWQLTPCNNLAVITLPGFYCLHLNDNTAIGKAQVYAEQYDLQDLPENIPLFY